MRKNLTERADLLNRNPISQNVLVKNKMEDQEGKTQYVIRTVN